MLSEESILLLEEQDNKSQFIDDLITGGQKPPSKGLQPNSSVSEGRISYLLNKQTEELKEFFQKNKSIASQKDIEVHKTLIDAPVRSKSDIKAEIDHLEEERKREQEFIQDEQSSYELYTKYQNRIDTLWKEFHA